MRHEKDRLNRNVRTRLLLSSRSKNTRMSTPDSKLKTNVRDKSDWQGRTVRLEGDRNRFIKFHNPLLTRS